jgi:hypothetical protein
MKISDRQVYQLKATLRGISPPIWRRIQVWDNYTLDQLHRVLQVAMGWENYHEYEFLFVGRKYGLHHPEDESKVFDSKQTRVRDAFSTEGAECEYLYDLGDYWKHDLQLECVLAPEPSAAVPCCVDGARSCPPEDVGGFAGYEDFLAARADPSNKAHEEMTAWRGAFDPEAFSVEEVNRQIEKKFLSPRKRTGPLRSKTAKRESSSTLEERRQAVAALPGFRPRQRIRVMAEETVSLELTERERELIQSGTSADEAWANRLRVMHSPGERPVLRLTLAGLDELAVDVGFEANQAKRKKLRLELYQLFHKIRATRDRYTDQDD